MMANVAPKDKGREAAPPSTWQWSPVYPLWHSQ